MIQLMVSFIGIAILAVVLFTSEVPPETAVIATICGGAALAIIVAVIASITDNNYRR